MNTALEDEDCKDRYVISYLRSDRFKDMKWEVNHRVKGWRVADMIFEGVYLSIKWNSI